MVKLKQIRLAELPTPYIGNSTFKDFESQNKSWPGAADLSAARRFGDNANSGCVVVTTVTSSSGGEGAGAEVVLEGAGRRSRD
jgi:hypothetical protein